jgi:C4-dicarboxylate-specific signal transduction histidine kinase
MPSPILLELDPAARWAVITLAILTVIYAVMRPWFRKKDPLVKPPAFASLSQQRAVERQMQNVLVELSDMARQITAQLDTRAAKLEALIREADEKIAAMKSPQPPSISPPPADPSPWESSQRELPPDPRHAQVYALADQGRSSSEIAHQLNRPSGEIELILALRR